MFGTSSPFPLQDRILRKFTGKGPRHDFLAMMASRSRQFLKDDFDGKALNTTDTWSITATSTATTWAVLAEAGGWIRGVTGASVATAGLQIYNPNKFWDGTRGAGVAALIRLSAVTDIRVEMGFGDVIPANSVTAVNYASNTFNSITTGAVYLFDNGVAASSTVTGLFTIGTSTAFNAVATTTNRFASGVALFVALEIDGTEVRAWAGDGDAPVASHVGAFAASEAWLPFLNFKGLGATKNIDIDCIWTWSLSRKT